MVDEKYQAEIGTTLEAVIQNDRGLSFKGSYAFLGFLVFSIAAATVFPPSGLLTFPTLLIIASAGGGGFLGWKWGKHKWETHQADFKEAIDKHEKEDALKIALEANRSIISQIPLLSQLIRTGQWLAKKVSEKREAHKESLLVADLTAGVGIAVGYEVGFMVGSFIMPGIGSMVGAGVGAAVGFIAGSVVGVKSADYLNDQHKISHDKQRVVAAGSIAGAGLGAAVGGFIGTFLFPGVGSFVGAAIGATLGAGGGAIYAAYAAQEGGLLYKFSEYYSMGPGISSGAMLGGLMGSVVPGVGTAIGAFIGAVAGGGMTWAVTRYGNHLRERNQQFEALFHKQILPEENKFEGLNGSVLLFRSLSNGQEQSQILEKSALSFRQLPKITADDKHGEKKNTYTLFKREEKRPLPAPDIPIKADMPRPE